MLQIFFWSIWTSCAKGNDFFLPVSVQDSDPVWSNEDSQKVLIIFLKKKIIIQLGSDKLKIATDNH